MDLYAIRRENLARLLEPEGRKKQLAERLDLTNQSYVSQLLSPKKKIHEDTARRIELVMGLEPGALDGKAPTPPAAAPHQAPPDLELLESTVRQVLAALAGAKVQVTPEKSAQIARLVYASAVAGGRVDQGFIHQLVMLLR